jgi:hypothetical protein
MGYYVLTGAAPILPTNFMIDDVGPFSTHEPVWTA